MRLFVALDLGKEIEKECKRLQELLPEEGIIKTKRYHLTIAFLGEVQSTVMEKVQSSLLTISQKKFILQTTSLGVFPSQNNIRVIWLGINNSPELYALQKSIGDVLKPLHFSLERDFHPHITLARVKFVKQKNKILEKMKVISATRITTTVTSFILFESIRTNGLEHKELLRIPFQ